MSADAIPAAQVAALLEATAAQLEAELSALGDAEAAWHPAPGEWCVKEVLGHLIEAEARGFAERIRTLLAEARPTFVTWDQPAVAAARQDCERPAADLLGEFHRRRAESAALVRRLASPDFARAGLHPTVGELSIADLLQEWVHHDRNHVKQILSVVQARVWPHLGNAQRFSRPAT